MSTYDELFLSAMQNNESSEESDQGDVLDGKIISKSDNEYFISAGGKSEMMLPFSETVQDFQVGDVVKVVFNNLKDGVPQVSQKKALLYQAREDVYAASQDNTPVLAKIIKLVTNKEGQNSGFEVSIHGVEAFLPMSQIRTGDEPASLVGTELNVAVIKHERNKIVVSERVLRDSLQKEHFEFFTQNYSVGAIASAVVDVVNDTFALLTIDNIRVFMAITEFDWKFIKSLKDYIKSGDKFNVQILEINVPKQSVRVSRKAVIDNPLDVFFNMHKVSDVVTTKVVRFARGLAIVEASCGTELLLPVGEMSWTSKVSDPKRLLNIGDQVEVKIKEMNTDTKRIVVSLRDILENPWSQANKVYAQGTKHHGVVISITDFGIFIEFEDGLQGLIRKEDIDWQDANVDLEARFKKGDSVTATVLHVDGANQKLRLGIKQLSKNPLQNFADNYPVGSIVSGVITKILKDKVDVEVEDGLTAFIHVSQLSVDHVTDPSTVVKEGQAIKAKLRRMNTAQQSIELSIKEMIQQEEKQEMQEYLSSKEFTAPTLGSMFGDILKK